VNVNPKVLYNTDLPDSAVRFYAQVLGLAWRMNYRATPPVTMEELESITGRKHTAIRGYMTLLRTSNALQWRTTGLGTFIFTFHNQSDSMNPEILNPLPATSNIDSQEGVVEEISLFQKSGSPRSVEAPAGFTPSDGSARTAEQLYCMITNQVTFPPAWGENYISALANVLTGTFKGNMDEAARSAQPVFSRWRNTRNKAGKPYSKSGVGWLDWWIDELTSKPDATVQPSETEEEKRAKARERVQKARQESAT
jgi:hypothetical protein